MNHTWAKDSGEVLEIEKEEPKTLDEILHFFFRTGKTRRIMFNASFDRQISL